MNTIAGGAQHIPQTFSPSSIKCSNCGSDLDLEAVENHKCVQRNQGMYRDLLFRPCADDRKARPPASFAHAPFAPPPLPAVHLPPQPTSLKARRPTLPRIDPSAASMLTSLQIAIFPCSLLLDRPPFFLGELTPASSGHGSMELSPRSTSSIPRSPYRMPGRQMTVPVIRRSPSPELMNLDCAFPPFPTSASQSKSKNTDRKSSTGSNNQSAGNSARSSSFGAASVRSKRATSISSSRNRNPSKAQPSVDPRRPSTSSNRRPSFGLQTVARKGSIEEPLPAPLDASHHQPWIQNDGTGSTNILDDVQKLAGENAAPMTKGLSQDESWSEGRLNFPPPQPGLEVGMNSAPQPGPMGAQLIKKLSYKARRPPPIDSSKSLPLIKRFKSILAPKRTPTMPLISTETPPETPGLETDVRSLALSQDSDKERNDVFQFDFDLPPPPDEPLDSNTQAERLNPPVSEFEPSASEEVGHDSESVEKVEESIGFSFKQSESQENLHTESDHNMTAKTHEESNSDPRILHDDDILDLEDLVSPTTQVRTSKEARNTVRTSVDSASSYGSTLSLQTTSSRSSVPAQADDQSAGVLVEPDADRPESTESESYTLLPPRIPEIQPDSPTDPLFQEGRLSPIPPATHRQSPSVSSKFSYRSSILLEPAEPRTESLQLAPGSATNKGICRGCSSIILSTQRSVASADGRLTGRYHKRCFVCTTCKSPFATADFYVLEDHPYCEQHYHELNGTICAGCAKGIEGQYIETAGVSSSKGTGATKKYHTECLACSTCKIVMKDDYFELNGRVYCEKDAFRIANAPTSRSGFGSAPARPSPLVRELVASSVGPRASESADENAEADEKVDNEPRVAGSMLALGARFPERRLTRLMTDVKLPEASI